MIDYVDGFYYGGEDGKPAKVESVSVGIETDKEDREYLVVELSTHVESQVEDKSIGNHGNWEKIDATVVRASLRFMPWSEQSLSINLKTLSKISGKSLKKDSESMKLICSEQFQKELLGKDFWIKATAGQPNKKTGIVSFYLNPEPTVELRKVVSEDIVKLFSW